MLRSPDSKLVPTLVVLLWMATLCPSVQGQRKYAEPEKVTGQINWIIREAATGKTIDRGAMTIHVRDIKVERKSSEDEDPFFSKRIDLNRDFYFEMAEFPETDLSDFEGFGLVIEHRNLRSFCWECLLLTGKSTPPSYRRPVNLTSTPKRSTRDGRLVVRIF